MSDTAGGSRALRTRVAVLDDNNDFEVEEDVSTFVLSSRLGAGNGDLDLTARDTRRFVYICSGEGSVSLDGINFTLRAGSLVDVPSSTVCHFHLRPGSEGMSLGIRDAYMRSHIVPTLPVTVEAGPRYWDAYYTPAVFNDFVGDAYRSRRDEVMRELIAASKRLGLGCDPAVAAYMLVVMFEPHLIATMESPTEPWGATQHGSRSLVLEFRNLIEQNYMHHLQVHDYCKLLEVTPRRLSQACQAATGMKPLSLIHDRIILEAKRELSCSTNSIAQIACALGFEDVGYFSRFIKQRTGRSPMGFRR
jgi:AraC family transcriptional activator of pobA